MNKDGMNFTGGYVVIHHGVEGEHSVPFFLVDPFRGTCPHTFTMEIRKAAIFYKYSEAKEARIEENARLEAEEHPLAGKVTVGELFVRDYKEED